jgi:hypothetical protein
MFLSSAENRPELAEAYFEFPTIDVSPAGSND